MADDAEVCTLPAPDWHGLPPDANGSNAAAAAAAPPRYVRQHDAAQARAVELATQQARHSPAILCWCDAAVLVLVVLVAWAVRRAGMCRRTAQWLGKYQRRFRRERIDQGVILYAQNSASVSPRRRHDNEGEGMIIGYHRC